jgi:hypothetical protein
MPVVQFKLTPMELRSIEEFCETHGLPESKMINVVEETIPEGDHQGYYMGLITAFFRVQQLLNRVPKEAVLTLIANLMARTVSLIEVPRRDEPSVN